MMAKAILQGPGHLHTHNATESSQLAALSTEKEVPHTTDEALNSSVMKSGGSAQPLLRNSPPGVVIGASHSALHTIESALTSYVAANAMAVATAQKTIDDLEKCDEFKDYQAAVTKVDSARHTADQLKLAKAALSAANGRWNFLENMTTWAAKHSLEILHIKRGTLSGSFHDFAHVKGHLGFDTVIEGTIVGQDFRLTPMLDLRDHTKFIGNIFLK